MAAEFELTEGQEISTTTTLVSIIGEKVKGPLSDELLQSPLNLSVKKTPQGLEYFASISTILVGEDFHKFLALVANNVFDVGIYGIVADWELPDDASSSGDQAYYQRLQSLHSKLGEVWITFENHRKRFISTINDKALEFSRYLPLPFNLMTKAEVDKEIASRFKTSTLEKDRDKFLRSISHLSADEVRDLLRGSRRNGKLNDRERYMNDRQLRFRLMHRVRNSSIFGEQFLKSSLWTGVYEEFFNDYRIVRVEPENEGTQPREIGYRRFTKSDDCIDTELARNKIENNCVYELCEEDGRFKYRLVESSKPTNGMLPVVHWIKNNAGSRVLLADELNTPTVQFSLDTLLGILTVAYFSPEIRKEWPQRVGLPGSYKQQEMGPAQIPVLALIRKNELEHSEFLEKLEGALQIEDK